MFANFPRCVFSIVVHQDKKEAPTLTREVGQKHASWELAQAEQAQLQKRHEAELEIEVHKAVRRAEAEAQAAAAAVAAETEAAAARRHAEDLLGSVRVAVLAPCVRLVVNDHEALAAASACSVSPGPPLPLASPAQPRGLLLRGGATPHVPL